MRRCVVVLGRGRPRLHLIRYERRFDKDDDRKPTGQAFEGRILDGNY